MTHALTRRVGPITIACALWGCAPPDAQDLFHDAELTVERDPVRAEQRFADAILDATSSIHVALPELNSDALTDALFTVWDEVADDPEFIYELVVDIDQRNDPGVAALIEAEAPVVLADDGITYFEFALNEDVAWSSDQTTMSHAYAVIDEQRIVTATTAGHLRSGPRVVLDLRGELLVEDLLAEHNQLFGGTDAVSVTAFSSPAKSIADFRWQYPTTSDAMLEMWFSPQERTTKRVIDAVYAARSGIKIMTNDFANEGLADALKEKASWGFSVEVVVGPQFGTAVPPLAARLLDSDSQVRVVRINDLSEIPALALIDLPQDRDGNWPRARAMMLTHDLVSSARFYQAPNEDLPAPVVTDQFIDGALWVLTDRTEDREEMIGLRDLFQELFDRGEPL